MKFPLSAQKKERITLVTRIPYSSFLFFCIAICWILFDTTFMERTNTVDILIAPYRRFLLTPYCIISLAFISFLSATYCIKSKTQVIISGRSFAYLLITSVLLSSAYIYAVTGLPAYRGLSFSFLAYISYFCLATAVLGNFSIITSFLIFFPATAFIAARMNHTVLSVANLIQIFATSLQDAKAFLSPLSLILFFCFIGTVLLIHYSTYHFLRKERKTTLLSTGGISFFLLLAGLHSVTDNFSLNEKNIFPLSPFIHFSQRSLQAALSLHNSINTTLGYFNNPSAETSLNFIKPDEGIICILHMGESATASHFSINGYEKNTTPWLKEQHNIINYKDCVSGYQYTDQEIIALFTECDNNYIESKSAPQYGSIVDYFADNHFLCYTFWINGAANPAIGGSLFAAEVQYISRKASHLVEQKGISQESDIAEIIDYINKGNKNNQFVTIYNRGSHLLFDNFDHENPPFSPVRICRSSDNPAKNKEEAANMIRCYDNTIAYTDLYIQEIITQLKGKPYIYIYTSDHGEYLGEDGFWLRPHTSSEHYHKTRACQVPLIILYSAEFENLHPEFAEAISELKKHQEIAISHEHIFHTILGIMGIQSPSYDKNKDLSSKTPAPYTGPHPGSLGKAVEAN